MLPLIDSVFLKDGHCFLIQTIFSCIFPRRVDSGRVHSDTDYVLASFFFLIHSQMIRVLTRVRQTSGNMSIKCQQKLRIWFIVRISVAYINADILSYEPGKVMITSPKNPAQAKETGVGVEPGPVQCVVVRGATLLYGTSSFLGWWIQQFLPNTWQRWDCAAMCLCVLVCVSAQRYRLTTNTTNCVYISLCSAQGFL